jgi:hypothetical protein
MSKRINGTARGHGAPEETRNPQSAFADTAEEGS